MTPASIFDILAKLPRLKEIYVDQLRATDFAPGSIAAVILGQDSIQRCIVESALPEKNSCKVDDVHCRKLVCMERAWYLNAQSCSTSQWAAAGTTYSLIQIETFDALTFLTSQLDHFPCLSTILFPPNFDSEALPYLRQLSDSLSDVAFTLVGSCNLLRALVDAENRMSVEDLSFQEVLLRVRRSTWRFKDRLPYCEHIAIDSSDHRNPSLVPHPADSLFAFMPRLTRLALSINSAGKIEVSPRIFPVLCIFLTDRKIMSYLAAHCLVSATLEDLVLLFLPGEVSDSDELQRQMSGVVEQSTRLCTMLVVAKALDCAPVYHLVRVHRACDTSAIISRLPYQRIDYGVNI